MTNASPHPRVRFAPSPTGFLHVGGLRTALYNYLFARKSNGVFVLRIEDTDRGRYVEGAAEKLVETLEWAGLGFDEGPGKPGAHGPYVQSERLQIYRTHVDMLLESQKAYRCFCTGERLDLMRKELERQKLTPKYDRLCMRLLPAEIEANLAGKKPYVVRMKIPGDGVVSVPDIIRGKVEIGVDQLDDQVLMKSDGYPTYHLANVVDDHLMEISHVIRGEEWLPSTPKHVLLYRYFGWELPIFAHLPLLLNPDRSKLSKRQGDVAVEEYRGKGYLKEALVNFVALLGWNPGTEEEFFLLEDLVGRFSLEQVNKSGAIFNVDKLDWLNAEHLRRKSDAELVVVIREELARRLPVTGAFSDEYLTRVVEVMRPRASFPGDFVEQGTYFFQPPAAYDPESLKKRWTNKSPEQMRQLADAFANLRSINPADFEEALKTTAVALGVGNGDLIHAVRLAISGVSGGPGVYDILSILGKDESVARIHKAITTLTV